MLIATGLDDFKPRALRVTVSGGEAVNPEMIDAWHAATGITIREIYGQSETVVLATSMPPLPLRPGSMGQPAPGQPVAIVDDDGNETPTDVEGHIAVRITPQPPLGLFSGYWGDEERTRAAFAGDWYLTGDRARRDADGYFWFAGRADDIIKSAGHRVSPFEVESVLLEHPGRRRGGGGRHARPDPWRRPSRHSSSSPSGTRLRMRSPPNCWPTAASRPPPTSARARSSS